MVSPRVKRQTVRRLVDEHAVSERHACGVVGLARSTARYRPRARQDEAGLVETVRDYAHRLPSYGYRLVTAVLRREGYPVNHKRIYRLWRREGLQLPRRVRRKRRVGEAGEVKRRAEYVNHVWSYDFLEDRTEGGSKLRFLTILDEFTRECLAIYVARSVPLTCPPRTDPGNELGSSDKRRQVQWQENAAVRKTSSRNYAKQKYC
jgi:transposase InsO family protein